MVNFIEPETIIIIIAGSVLLVSLLVAGRFFFCIFKAFQERKFGTALLALAGLVCSFLLVAAVLTVWFGYAVAHTQKDTTNDLKMFFVTIPPYFLLQLLLWLGGGKLAPQVQVGNT